ncbi:hypothetical protein LshimejAT787_0504850 [Lyophyllum shimeji]|uniref:Uncharacterized protein n=1 Tax=Lyophyllum shimeji TaxID=47721 RepID=A0A9P3UP54_LYOSH|nr:hypothetical protein LshimejAT787_0504850 [Lyophyllum shimeji]
MASIASSSSSPDTPATTSHGSPRPQAGPLPSKRGEIGYVEGVHTQDGGRSSSPDAVLPARHPADRDNTNASASTTTSDAPPAANSTASQSNTTLASSSTATLVSSASQNSTSKKVLSFFRSRKNPTFFGFSLTTFLAFLLQLAFIGGSIAAWVLLVRYASQRSADGFSTTAIFIHVIFGVALLAQLLFIERRIFRLRAERYSYLHPGEILPSARSRPVDPSIAFSPWNRPPLPTYAAALAQSGVGTGDVEDHLIAAPPPPAYGNTRGSTLLLAGFLRDSLRAQRPLSGRSQMSQRGGCGEGTAPRGNLGATGKTDVTLLPLIISLLSLLVSLRCTKLIKL